MLLIMDEDDEREETFLVSSSISSSSSSCFSNKNSAPRARQLRVFAERKNRTNDFLRELRATKRKNDEKMVQRRDHRHYHPYEMKWRAQAKAKVDTRREKKSVAKTKKKKIKKKKKKSVVFTTETTTTKTTTTTTRIQEEEEEKKKREEKEEEKMLRKKQRGEERGEPMATRRAKEAVNMLKSDPVSPRENVERYYECIEVLRERRKRAARDAFEKAKSKREERRKRKEEERAAKIAAAALVADGEDGEDACDGDESAESSDSDEGEEDEETRKILFQKELSYEFKTVWKDIAHESKDMMNKETHRDAIKSLELELRRTYVSARLIFKHYALWTKPFDENIGAAEFGSMTLNDWFAFLKDCDLIGANSVDENNKKMLKSSAELLFIRLNWITDASGRKVKNADTTTNSDRSLVITEFCVGILRLAKALRPKKYKNEMLSETLARFMKERIIPRAKFVDVEPFRSRMRARRVLKVLEKNKSLITHVFEKYAAIGTSTSIGAAGLRTIDLNELVGLVKDMVARVVPSQNSGGVHVKFLVVQRCFGLSQKEVLGEDAGEIDREEFDELVGRLAEEFYDGTCFAPPPLSTTTTTTSEVHDTHAAAAAAAAAAIPSSSLSSSSSSSLADKIAWFIETHLALVY